MLHTSRTCRITTGRALSLALLLLLSVIGPELRAADPRLHELRAARRQAHKALQLDPAKTDGPALFGLLVIPVDFQDERLPADWDPAAEVGDRLWGLTGESLHHYFSVASAGQVDLRPTLAPVVHLTGTRRDYSDVGLNGFSRTRALATEALETVRSLGLEFRSLDMEGPDRIPGSADDDGELDGVLILHAAAGQENDPENGLIQPLQFFLEEPVVSGGIAASFYAVASLQSGPGIWAHETGHLLGMEDRYDPLLHPEAGGVDVRSLGGLGRFSLMASGAWGTGGGWGAALPDGYTCWQMGWFSVRQLGQTPGINEVINPGLVGGALGSIWTAGVTGSEFFLVETRDPVRAAPFDAGIPAGQLLIYHVDETVPEGGWAADGHLRVHLVEADADQGLATGQDDGRLEDLFPGPLGVTEFGPGTIPSSWGYEGDSLVQLTAISTLENGVALNALAAEETVLEVALGFTAGPDAVLELDVRSLGLPFTSLTCTLTETGLPTWGSFPGGVSSYSVSLVEGETGTWSPDQAALFALQPDLPAGAASDFTLAFAADGAELPLISRHWIWNPQAGALDFSQEWPGQWNIRQEGIGTTWHRWSGPPYLTPDQGPVLAATGEQFTTSAAWPEVLYSNRAWTVLQTPELVAGNQAVRLIHALGAEVLTGGEAMDGARFSWAGPGQQRRSALPVDGYPRRINPGAVNPLAGQAVFADTLLLDGNNHPIWQVDLVPLPAEPGPWRLELELASNTLWRREGWFVADLELVDVAGMDQAFPVTWSKGSGLSWQWSHSGAAAYDVQYRTGNSGAWLDLATGVTTTQVAASEVLGALGGGPGSRSEVRVLASTGWGLVASRPVVVYPDGGLSGTTGLLQPRPNPAVGQVSMQVQLEVGQSGTIKIFDLRGRLIHSRKVSGGNQVLTWDGRDRQGALAPSGLYFIRLEGSGPVQTRKVVFLH